MKISGPKPIAKDTQQRKLYLAAGAGIALLSVIALSVIFILPETVKEISSSEILKDVEPGDLVKYGLIPEFVGRLPVLATLEDLDEDALVKILTEPKNALTKQYKKLFEMENTNLDFRKEALVAIAKKAIELDTGARGLRSIIEKMLMETMFELPSQSNIDEVVINEDVVMKDKKPLTVHSKNKKSISQTIS